MKKQHFILIISILFIANSCVKKEQFELDRLSKTSWNPEIGIPLLYSSLTANNIVAKTDPSVVSTDANGVITLIYPGKKVEVTAGEIFTLADVSKTIPTIPLSGTTLPLDIPFAANGKQKFEKINLSAGEIKITADPGSGANGTLTFNFKSIGGGLTLELNQSNDFTKSIPENASLAGKTITLKNGEFQIDVTSTGSGSVNNVKIEFVNLDYESIIGDFADTKLKLPTDSFQINLFKNVAEKGDFYLNDPRLKLSITNGFGIPFALNLEDFYGYIPLTDEKIPFNNSSSTKRIKISGVPSLGASPVVSNLLLDKNNSNIQEFIRPTPSWMYVSPVLESNPNSTTANNNFLTKTSVCAFESSLELPLDGQVIKFVLLDTLNLGLQQTLDVVQDFTLRSKVINGMPLTATVDVILLDKAYNPIYNGDEIVHLFGGSGVKQLCESALVVNGEVVGTTTSKEDYDVAPSKVKYLKEAAYARLRAVLHTTEGKGNIRIKSNNTFEVSMGMKLTGNLNLTE